MGILLPISAFMRTYLSWQYPELKQLINQQISALSNSELYKSFLGQILLSCIDAIKAPVEGQTKALNRVLYCGWKGVSCGKKEL